MTDARMRTSRSAFTAVELVVVIGIMMALMSIALPSVLPAIVRGKIHSAVNDITTCWRQARLLAMTNAIPSNNLPWHFGIAIKQAAGQQATVGVILDNVAAGDAKYLVEGEDPADQSTYDAAAKPVALFKFNRRVVVASTPAGGDNAMAPTTGDRTVLLYVQYGSGLPLSPDDVAAGRGLVSSPCSLGVASDAAITSTVCPRLQLWTQDYASGPNHRGYASSFSIYHAGFTVSQGL
jgi:Tfp pilus assembly protein FimT